MASSFEKSVKGATKIKAAPPKTKYIEHILIATHSGEHGVAEVFRSLQNRLRDSTWTVVFKSLITVHLMIREGSPDVTLAFLASHRNMLSISSFTDVQTQGRNIRHYANYLSERAKAYRDTKCDYVRGAEHRFERLTIDKGLLRETEIVQAQIEKLLRCDVLDSEPETEITITVFRMLVLDLLAMFHVVNQAMINILGHFFEMSRSDAERALGIYLDFTKQTEQVVSYLATARQWQHQTRVEVPKIKHAPTNLGKQLEDYLADPDFEINRRQYLAEQDAKKGRGKGTSNGISMGASSSSRATTEARSAAGKSFPDVPKAQPTASKPIQQAKGPDPDLIDFFDSIEQNQQPMAMATQATLQQQASMPGVGHSAQYQVGVPLQFQQTGFMSQPGNFTDMNQFQQQPNSLPFVQPPQNPSQPVQFPPTQQYAPGQQSMPTGMSQPGFGGYASPAAFSPSLLSSIPQNQTAAFAPQTGMSIPGPEAQPQPLSNPFRQSMLAANPTGMSASSFTSGPQVTSPLAPQSTNPFKHMTAQQTSPPPQIQQAPMAVSSLQPMPTGTNPFARGPAQAPIQQQNTANLVPQPTGSTNPFRQSQFVNTATGTGWQHNQMQIGGGLDSLETVPVFPRPGQQQAWQQ